MKKIVVFVYVFLTISASAQDQFQKEAAGFLSFTKGKIDQLVSVIPEEKYGWRPSEDVRSLSGVIGHVITTNYVLGLKLGGELPEGVDPMSIEKSLTQKGELTKALTISHDFVLKAINNLQSEDLNDAVELPFPGEYTKMTVVNLLITHASEHLGQMIAYARMNNVSPPWSEN